MKINYKILWLDDEIDAFREDEFIDKVQQHLEEKGFAPDIQTVAKVTDFFDQLDDSFDFILTDYNMAEKNGAQVIADIREKSIFTEILFYTAQVEWEEIGKLDRISFLQTSKVSGGTHHEKVIDKAINIIDLTIKKFQHIVAMRGMIMHETSTLDAQSMDILKSYLNCRGKGCGDCTDKERCKPISDSIFEKLEQQFLDKIDDVVKLKEKNNLQKLIKDNFLFSAEYKIEALSKILTNLNMTDFSADYKTEIITVRNKFAHAVLEKDEKTGREYFKHGEDGITFDEDYCQTIRKNIIKHKQNLDNLQNSIHH
jgi:CheY-like chemotaxis protein